MKTEQAVEDGPANPLRSFAAHLTVAFGTRDQIMQPFKIDFGVLEWQTPLPGVRFKSYGAAGRQIRLVEFTSEFIEPQWCERGHIGLVLEGSLEIDFQGQVLTYGQGQGIFIQPGPECAHKARSLTPVVRLVLVEDE